MEKFKVGDKVKIKGTDKVGTITGFCMCLICINNSNTDIPVAYIHLDLDHIKHEISLRHLCKIEPEEDLIKLPKGPEQLDLF